MESQCMELQSEAVYFVFKIEAKEATGITNYLFSSLEAQKLKLTLILLEYRVIDLTKISNNID